ncbi:MAG: hypothetical protein U0792_04055 [Gemmataceae bacterium]
MSYFPKSKTLWLAYRLLNDEVTPAVLRTALDSYAEAVKKSLEAVSQPRLDVLGGVG